ncbi:MAG: carboxypeptidase regulatory-like domain-containing protein [Planctomycetes bacterium]|nr:carboxypeptidase regulatory-like domain-containing protein [Planctomycetota bacterium]
MKKSSILRWIPPALTALVAAYVLAIVACMIADYLCPRWVWNAELAGRVTDEHGEAVAGAQVVAEYFDDRSAEDAIPGSLSPAITDEKGEFVMNVVPGAVTLFARKDGLGFSVPRDLEPQDWQELAGLELVLDPGGRIVGECVGADGKPHSGRWIAIEQAVYPHWWDEDRIVNLRTGGSGEFGCEVVPSGRSVRCSGAAGQTDSTTHFRRSRSSRCGVGRRHTFTSRPGPQGKR